MVMFVYKIYVYTIDRTHQKEKKKQRKQLFKFTKKSEHQREYFQISPLSQVT